MELLSHDEVIRLGKQLWDAQVQNWLQNTFNTWLWYLSVIITVFIMVIWWKYVDKKRLLEISFLGLIINTTATFLDELGVNAALWSYPNKLLPITVGLTPANYFVLPVIFMLVYQYFPTWKAYITAWLIVSAVISFVVDPFLISINYYNLIRWENHYSYIVFIILAIFARLLTEFFVSKTKEQKE